jgi:hypothetical protein
MAKPLQKEFDYYRSHQDELVQKFRGRFIVIKDEAVIGDYGSVIDAVRETSKKHELGTFFVIECLPGTDSYTQTYRSRVYFTQA